MNKTGATIQNIFSITNILQVIVALGLLNVWVLRFHRRTAYRGGSANSMLEEFSAYGLPVWSCYAVGAAKILAALLLLVGLWIPDVVGPAAIGVALLMVGALAMHVKTRDPLKKYFPAAVVLLLCVTIALLNYLHTS